MDRDILRKILNHIEAKAAHRNGLPGEVGTWEELHTSRRMQVSAQCKIAASNLEVKCVLSNSS